MQPHNRILGSQEILLREGIPDSMKSSVITTREGRVIFKISDELRALSSNSLVTRDDLKQQLWTDNKHLRSEDKGRLLEEATAYIEQVMENQLGHGPTR